MFKSDEDKVMVTARSMVNIHEVKNDTGKRELRATRPLYGATFRPDGENTSLVC